MKAVQIIVEKHAEGYLAYPVGIEGVEVGQGDTFEAGAAGRKISHQISRGIIGPAVLESETLAAFVAETTV